ncbi:MAG: GntR family transcriptional regulator [Spirochaetia bacterium]|jgi:DNA-binding GntR family transcriptional regulator|nr:GntR family transcriptional regulator [Spirochaetia bacterium]
MVYMHGSLSASYPAQGSKAIVLRERVYRFLKEQLNQGILSPGSFMDLKAIGTALGISRTPLRDALIRLEAEGFVTIHSRRGVMVNELDLEAVRNAYQLVGALETAAIMECGPLMNDRDFAVMEALNGGMGDALAQDDFNAYYEQNLAFHCTYIDKSANSELRNLISMHRERLYDFPRRQAYLKAWELNGVIEHAELLRRMRQGDFVSAATYSREVHWSFAMQEKFVNEYYFARISDNEPEITQGGS